MRKMRPVPALALITFLSLGVGLYSLRFTAVPFGLSPGIDPAIQTVILNVPVAALAHMILGPIALLTGPWQFFSAVRARHPKLHRRLGQIYAVSCLLSGVAALVTAPHASGGSVAAMGFGLLAVLWIVTTALAWRAALRRDFDMHRSLMSYSFALTFAAVTLRLQIPIGIAVFHFPDYRTLSPWLSFTCWLPNLAAIWLYQTARRNRLATVQGSLPMR